MSVIGTIEKVWSGQTKDGKDNYRIKVGGKIFSGFNKAPANEGDTIEFDFKENGQYLNITKVLSVKKGQTAGSEIGESAKVKRKAEMMMCAKDLVLASMKDNPIEGKTSEESIARITGTVKIVWKDLMRTIGEPVDEDTLSSQ